MYATLADIERAYPGQAAILAPAQDPDDAIGIDAARIDWALTAATEEIDTALRDRHAVPLDPAPSLIVRFAVEIALALLPIDGATDNNLIQGRAKAARAALADLRDGRTSLGLPPPVVTGPTASGDTVAIEAAPAVFGGSALRVF